ncbi:MAG: hypothetical protein JWM10_1604 [Myxococcaceae bacterium]|nr:hypothetical protein [Myxococcaceae bacterium]
MTYRARLGLLLPFLASAAVGCSDDPVPVSDAGSDAGDTGVVVDTGTDVGRDTGTDSGGLCPSVEFIRPAPAAVLGVADDLDNNCSNGFAYGVQFATNAAIGSRLELYVNGRLAGNTTVSGATVRFEGVQFDTGATSTLEVRLPGSATACGMSTVSVDCGVPRCSITAPARSALNLTDSTAAAGMPFATSFVVGTNVEDGREVELSITGTANPLRAAVMGGMARFANVRLSPDGEFVTRATCTNRAGNVGRSAEARFTVDSVAPTLAVQSPMAGAVIGLSGDVNAAVAGVQFNVCARSDAAGRRLCANVMGSTPADPAGCADVPASATTDACVQVTCPDGNAPFTVEVSTQDVAGNEARGSIANVRCQSSLPSVRVVAPAPYSSTDATTILNAARDTNPAVAGLQVDVVACTDRTAGTAVLLRDAVTTPLATAAVAPTAAGDPCAALGMGFVGIARFPGVTLPETFPARNDPTAPAPTGPSLQVQVTDGAGDRGASAASTFYVDSSPPTVNIFNCNRLVRPDADGIGRADVVVSSDGYPVVLTLTHEGDTPTTRMLNAPTGTGGMGTFMNVPFLAGTTTLRLAATDPAGNASTTNGMCTVDVGNPPMLAFTAPLAGATFTTRTTTVRLSTDAPNGTVVSLSVNGGAATTAAVSAGVVTFANLMLPEGDAVSLVATTANVPARGVGTASVTVVVDSGVPTAPAALVAVVPTTPPSARRAGTIRLTFTDGSDPSPSGVGTRPVARYEVRTANVSLDAVNWMGGTVSLFTATPGAAGTPNTGDISGLQLGRPYYVGMRSYDAAGNASPTVVSVGPIVPDIIVDQFVNLVPPLGNSVSGGHDFNGDGFADVLVGSGATSGGLARVYYGSATGISTTNYTEFLGAAADGRFGTAVAALGDINGDGRADFAIAEPGPTSPARAGIVYLYFGRPASMWRTGSAMAYLANEASVTLTGGTADLAAARLGTSLARVGDFDGDSINDVAIGASFATNGGAVVLFRGRTSLNPWPATLSPNAADLIIRNNGMSTVFGVTLAGIGRVLGGDTREDLAIGGGASATPGTAYIFAGRALPAPLALTVADATFTRPGLPVGTAGTTTATGQNQVGGVGDINGDGRSDFAVGTLAGQMGPGEVYLYFGGSDGNLTAGPTLRTTAAGVTNDIYGRSLASIYDPSLVRPSLLQANAPSADLLVGSAAYLASNPARMYIYRGRASTAWTGLTTDSADRFVAAPASMGTNSTISSLNWVGDTDGDGAVDAAIALSGFGTMLIVR